ncbi:MAG: hypothetical protein K8R76_02080 [Candidatus Aegiribacteria sp.]|nr:hypothetical protein [Candidatus Aegiribacteria sp.]
MWNFRTRLLPMIVTGILIWVFFLYSHNLVSRLKETRASANETIAWFWAGTQVPMSRLSELGSLSVCSQCGSSEPFDSVLPDTTISRFCRECGRETEWHVVSIIDFEERNLISRRTSALFQELVNRLEYYTILSDQFMVPQVVNGTAVPDTISERDMKSYQEMIITLDELNPPVPMEGASGEIIGYLHYGSDDLTRELTLVPYIELGMLFLLAFLFMYAIRIETKREKELSWIGFAKETAHQISTPLTSLMGWLELLHERPEAHTDKEFSEALEYIENDVERLKQIANRYGQMGKKPKLENNLVNPIILDTVHYFYGRPGLINEEIKLETDLCSEQIVYLNRVLFGWVVENLLKNSLSSLGSERSGMIMITSNDIEEGPGLVEIEIADNGKGIAFRDQKKIFNAGFSTRRGGWGLGLTLSKRIIEEYHNGSIRLRASSPGKGTTFTIVLPAAPKGEE